MGDFERGPWRKVPGFFTEEVIEASTDRDGKAFVSAINREKKIVTFRSAGDDEPIPTEDES